MPMMTMITKLILGGRWQWEFAGMLLVRQGIMVSEKCDDAKENDDDDDEGDVNAAENSKN